MGRFSIGYYFLTLLLIGMGYLLTLPPFEGFDETAHYSSIRQIADKNTIPIYGHSFLDLFTEHYEGPKPYGNSMSFNTSREYKEFFTDSQAVKNYINLYHQSSPELRFQPGQPLNWEAQHPPLYYLLMAQLIPLIKHYSFTTQFFILRLCSYLLALSGVALGILASRQNAPHCLENSATSRGILEVNKITGGHQSAMLGFILYPFVLPMFFPEFTRIGNDALCIFWVGLLTLLIARWQVSRITYSGLIGVVLGLGLLTKSLFAPITAGVSVYFSIRLYYDKPSLMSISQKLFSLLLMFLPAFLIGGSWYLFQYVTVGQVTGSADAAMLAEEGGFLANFHQHFSLFNLLKGMVSPLMTYTWSGTWSLTQPQYFLYLPLLFSLAWFMLIYGQKLRNLTLADPLWLPMWIMVFFALGLIAHVILCLALFGTGNTPGWYLHILMPWVAPLFGISVMSLWQQFYSRVFILGLVGYSLVFQCIAVWSQLSLYAGCAVKGIDKHHLFPNYSFCLDQFPLIIHRLNVLAWPELGIGCFMSGFLLVLIFWSQLALLFMQGYRFHKK